ncbi:MAG: hypothetical protein RBS89_08050 [Candidatus Delongbacteria bacterium]|nr:hypothetical protein [Candidatus Delongbacteria bacterium]
MFFCACNFHCFVDGNKRIALALGAQFLIFNGYIFIAKIFLQEMENISYHVAAGKIDKDLLQNIISELLNEGQISDGMKLEIFNAIQD